MFQLQRLFSSRPRGDHPNNDVLYAHQGKDIHEILFEKGAIAENKITVGMVRAAVGTAAGLPADSIKLLSGGKNLKDDILTVSSYGIKAGSKILCMASKTKLTRPEVANKSGGARGSSKSPSPAPKKVILTPMQKINLTRDFTKETLMPLVLAFESSPPTDPERKEDEHRRLTETVMGELIKLDGVDVDGEDGAEVRKQRKETVRDMQRLLERLDVILKGPSKLSTSPK